MKKGEILPLTGLRGYAAAWVVASHIVLFAGYMGQTRLEGPTAEFARAGYLGVDIFFVLSGFVIAHAYAHRVGNSTEMTQFLWNRVARMLPALLACYLLGAGLLLSGRMGFTVPIYGVVHDLPYILSMTHTWFDWNPERWGTRTWVAINGAFWSVSAEWFAYLMFPLLLLVARSRSQRVAWATSLWGLLLGLTFFVPGGLGNCVFGYAACLRVLAGFTIGVVAHDIFESRRLPLIARRRLLTIAAGLVGAVLLQSMVSQSSGDGITLDSPFEVLLLVATGCLLVAIAENDIPACRLFDNPLMLYLGRISYSIYLVHVFVILIGLRTLSKLGMVDWMTSMPKLILVSVPIVLATVVAGHLLHAWVERPAQRALQSLWLSDPAVSVPSNDAAEESDGDENDQEEGEEESFASESFDSDRRAA